MNTKFPNRIKSVLRGLSGVMLAVSLACISAQALPFVSKVGGGLPVWPYSGHVNGDTYHASLFNSPAGMAIDPSGEYLYIADQTNNMVRVVDFDLGVEADFGTTEDMFTMTNYVQVTNLFSRPVGVAIDSSFNVFVLNRANNTNGTILQFDPDGELIATNLAKITNASALAVDSNTNLYLTTRSNVFKISVTTHTTTLIATVHDASANLKGIAVKHNGLLAVCDYGRNGILFIDPVSGIIITNAGFHGAGDFLLPNDTAIAATAKFNGPMGVVETGDGTLIVSDYNNDRVKAVLTSGIVTNIYGIPAVDWVTPTNPPAQGQYPGWQSGQVLLPDNAGYPNNVQSRAPNGVVFAPDGSIYVSEDYYHLIRKVTGSGLVLLPPVPQPPPAAPINLTVVTTNFGSVTLSWASSSGATNYIVFRSTSTNGFSQIAVVPDTGTQTLSFTDTTVGNGVTYYYEVAAANAFGQGPVSAYVMTHTPTPPPPPPRIGWFDYEGNNLIGFTTVLHPVSSSIYNNDQRIAIDPGTNGVSTYYIAGPNPLSGAPGTNNGTSPPFYQDGLNFATPLPITTVPDLIIEAVSVDTLGQISGTTTAEFIFRVANPTVIGNNGAQFTVSDVTSNAVYWYTLDGTDPTNGAPSFGPIVSDANSDPVVFGFNVISNLTFKVRAFRNGYQSSGTSAQTFSSENFVPNTLSFGFANMEGSSAFVASPGQTFYAPVTLSMISNSPIYTLQFNLTATNGVTNSGPPLPAGSFGFQSLLEKPIPGTSPVLFEHIPPAEYVGLLPNPNPIELDSSTAFTSLLITNTSENLLSVGWIELIGQTNLYDTGSQSLITYSQAHDTQFLSSGGKILVGEFAIQIPVTAQTNQTYQIQLGRVSATTDGRGGSDSSISIAVPTNSGTGPGTLNALKYITIGQYKYVAGSVYPFYWFNAGDFGSSNIVNADVVQVFQSAIYQLNFPPAGSDFFDAMDSSGRLGALDSNPADANFGYYTNSGAGLGSINPLFSGDDTTINQDAFGDGFLDVDDVYVTFRRSLDPSLNWYRRFWNNGQRVAELTANTGNGTGNKAANSGTTKASDAAKITITSNSIPPRVNFSAGDIVGSAGQTVQIPITATIVGDFPLRLLMLNLTVTPLDGSPALVNAVGFTQTATALGTAYTAASDSPGNYAAVWLNSASTGLSNTVVIGTLNVKIPSTADQNAAYAVHFDHASASPNGLAPFPNGVLTGVLSTSIRTNSVYRDGIPDSWRLRWFGTTNNLLSVSNACPTGDGVDNWYKYVAGVDPNAAGDFPQTKTRSPSTNGYNYALHWPSVNGKQYAIERATALFGATWSSVTTNLGTGNDMEFDDNTTNKVRFYRVRIVQP